MKNLFISNLNEKDINHFTTNIGLFLRRKFNKPFKKLCNIFTNANIVRVEQNKNLTDEEYFNNIETKRIPLSNYNIKSKKNNIVLERYPELEKDESYIYVCNHTCPEDIETVLNIIDRNAYLVLGSIESLKYNPEMYLSWLNGMVVFDIVNPEQRKSLPAKMERILENNSILIFPEGSHNYHPNKIINNLFDGPINLSLKTGKKIVVVTLVKDKENGVAYIDVSNPVSAKSLKDQQNKDLSEKEQIKNMSLAIRDKMATAAYYLVLRHFDTLKRNDYSNIDKHFKDKYAKDAFANLKWDRDVFDAEYYVKKTKAEKEYEEVVKTLSNLKLDIEVLKNIKLHCKEFILKEMDIDNKDTANNMRQYWLQEQENKKKKIKKR